MNKINLGGIYYINNIVEIGSIYLRFFRSGKIVYLITSNIEDNDKVFNLLQKKYNNNDVVEYQINNDLLVIMINTEIGVLQLSGKINNNSIMLNITNTTKLSEVNNVLFSYYKKQYPNINNILNTKSKKVKIFKKKINENKSKEKIPGGPKMAYSYNGFSYRNIAKWGNY